MSKELKLTPWFGYRSKPARIGVYIATVNDTDFYRHWDGNFWLEGDDTPDAAAAMAKRHPIVWWNQSSIRWRGLAVKP